MNIEFRHIEYDDTYILNIPELKTFRESNIKDADYIVKLLAYFQWFCLYCYDIFHDTVYQDYNIIQEVFKNHSKISKKMSNNILHKHLYLCWQYIKFLSKNINEKNITLYEHTIWQMDHNIESLVIIREAQRQNKIPQNKIYLTCGVKQVLRTRDLFESCKSLFYIENNTIEDLYLLDLKPIVAFQLRQIIEIYGKRMIGLWSINNLKDGTTSKKFTQIVWKFIKERNNKSKEWHIEFPFEVDNIIAINDWTNRYTHTANIEEPYLLHFAIQVVASLFKSTKTPIKTIFGNCLKTMFAPVKIVGYNAMKKDFEDYIHTTCKCLFFRRKKKKYSVTWIDTKDIESYIISM